MSERDIEGIVKEMSEEKERARERERERERERGGMENRRDMEGGS